MAHSNTGNIAEDVCFSQVTEPQNAVLTSCQQYKFVQLWDEQVHGALGEELDEGQLSFNYNIPLLRLPGKKKTNTKKASERRVCRLEYF